MTLFLASVRDEAEAELALLARADLIDLKEPRRGALGAVDRETTMAIVSAIAGRTTVSATIGDLPMRAEEISAAVLDRTDCGVDYVKFGLFPEADARRCLVALGPVARSVRLIVVLFADRLPAFDAVATAADMGAAGVMLDTAGKTSGSLRDHLDLRKLASFVTRAKSHGLIVGLRRVARRNNGAGAAHPRARPAWLSRRALPRLPKVLPRSRGLCGDPIADPGSPTCTCMLAKGQVERRGGGSFMLGIGRP